MRVTICNDSIRVPVTYVSVCDLLGTQRLFELLQQAVRYNAKSLHERPRTREVPFCLQIILLAAGLTALGGGGGCEHETECHVSMSERRARGARSERSQARSERRVRAARAYVRNAQVLPALIEQAHACALSAPLPFCREPTTDPMHLHESDYL